MAAGGRGNRRRGRGRAEETRKALIREGSRLIRRRGYTDTGLVELLDTAGFPRGSFYHHFGSKEDFAVEVIEAFYAWHDVRLEGLAAERTRPALERLRAYFDTLLDRAQVTSAEERGCLLGMLALEKSATSPAIRRAVRRAFERWQERVSELVRQAQAEGSVDTGSPPAVLAGLVLHGWEGALLRARLEHDVQPLAEFHELGLPRLLGA